MIEEKRQACAYGLCLIASDRRTLRAYDLEDFNCDLFYLSSRDVSNALIVSPAPDVDLSGYRDFIFLDTPCDYNIRCLQGHTVYVNSEINGAQMFGGLSVARERMLDIFSALRREVNALYGENAEEVAISLQGLGFDTTELIFAVNVFEELGLVAFHQGKLTVYRGVKAELMDSKLYRRICHLQNG